ncbi:MAG: 5'-nucleotidase C-terminal domain-containing protein [Pseudomonadota bacterium]
MKVGFIGLTSDIVAHMSPALAAGFEFTQGEAAHQQLLERHAAALRTQGVDIVVVMSELGIHKDYQLAQHIRRGSVDVFFSAHTHEATFELLQTASGALVVEAGNDGYLGRMDVTVKNGRIQSHHWQLLEIGADIPEDARIARAVARARAPFLADNIAMQVPMMGPVQRLTQPIDTVIGYTAQPLDRRHALESSFNNFSTDMLRSVAGTEFALAPGFRFDSPVPATEMLLEDNTVATGAITLEDVYRYFPVVYSLATATTDGANLRTLLETALTEVYSADAFNQAGGWMPGLAGLQAEVDLSRPDGARVLSLAHADGRPIGLTDTLTVAGCRRPIDAGDTLCSYPGFSAIEPLVNPATGSAYTVVDFFMDALAKGYGPAEPRDSLHDVSDTPVWPAAAFVQPLLQ